MVSASYFLVPLLYTSSPPSAELLLEEKLSNEMRLMRWFSKIKISQNLNFLLPHMPPFLFCNSIHSEYQRLIFLLQHCAAPLDSFGGKNLQHVNIAASEGIVTLYDRKLGTA